MSNSFKTFSNNYLIVLFLTESFLKLFQFFWTTFGEISTFLLSHLLLFFPDHNLTARDEICN